MRIRILLVALLGTLSLWAIDQSYYTTINNKKGATLRDNLYEITLAGPKDMSYNKLWTVYSSTDVYPTDSVGKAGKIWDMYSNVLWTPGDDQCGSYSNVGSCYNREHSVPKSWFKEKTPAYYDLCHLVPTDGYVNNQRGNDPFGECANGTRLKNGDYVATGKYGSSTFEGYTSIGNVFEPDDQYKGDFARIYMYMAVRYKKGNTNEVSISGEMFNTEDKNYGFTDYSVALLMKWHRMDPVSVKEITRNDSMEVKQSNRNPFVDYPILAEYLWGNMTSETFTLDNAIASFDPAFVPGVSDGSNTTSPRIIAPAGTINFGSTDMITAITQDVYFHAANLEDGNLTLAISGDNAAFFSLASNTITKDQAETGYTITVTYAPTANGNHTATLTVSGCGVTPRTVTLTGSCTTIYTVTWTDVASSQTTKTANGTEAPLPDETPANCSADRVFVGWTANKNFEGEIKEIFTSNTPVIEADTTFYAVYADKEGDGNIESTAEVGATLWKEEFTGFKADDVPAASNSSTEVFNGASLTYSVTDGNGSTKVYSAILAGGTAPELLIAKQNGSFSIAGIPTGYATEMTLTFKSNKSTAMTVETGTKGITVGEVSYESGVFSCLITNSDNVEKFDLTITNGNSNNSREDDFLLVVTTAGASVTLSNYSLKCSTEPDIPTAVENVIDSSENDSSQPAARKILCNGQLLILRGNEVFSVDGRSINAILP